MIRKILVQDIVSKRSAKSGKDAKDAGDTEKGTINARERDFLIERLTRKHAPETPVTPVKSTPKTASKAPRAASRRKKGFSFGFRSKWFLFGLPVAIILVIFAVLQFFSGAIVTVTPKQMTVATSTTLVASTTTSPGNISYQVITLSAVESQIVPATGVVSTTPKKATGEIIVFNKFSAAPQALVQNTRFETADGLVYRTASTIKIPGVDAAGVPGSASVKVVADKTGSRYNIGLVDFTIPGFKTDPNRYSKIFGRSKTVMAGGMDSTSIGISETDRQNAQDQMEARLKDSLLKKVQAEKVGLELEHHVQEGIYNVEGDAFWLKEAVNNLIENSIKYTKQGKISVNLENKDGKALVSVKDNGVGITEEDKKNLFTEGGRGKDSIKINVDSTGYGLYTVKLVVEAHRGRVWAESEGAGKGSTFFIELPLT